jgi:sialate O-acetylesterase
MRRSRVGVSVGVCCFLVACQALAAVTMPSIFGDHMVLQQGKELPVWGKAAPGEVVKVTVGAQEASAIADGAGGWMARLSPLAPGAPVEMTVSGKDNTLTFTNVLVGEVWAGSGQSNMQWTVNNSANPEAEIAAANYPDIRLFYVERKVADTPQDDCNGQWMVCSPETISEFSAVLYYFGRELHKELGLPVGLIHTSWGGTPAESWTRRPTLEADPALNVIVQRWDGIVAEYPRARKAYETALAEWEEAAAKAKSEGNPEPAKPNAPTSPDSPHRAASLYNAMIAPLVPYAVQGAIWYQGESNASRAYQYRNLFSTMITDWREAWGQGAFPFYFVQLANFRDRKAAPAESDWAELREAQNMALALPNTGVAVTIDIGDAKDIHPKNKQDVGKRLALNALAKTYGRKVAWSGPVYQSLRVKGPKAILQFEHADGGLKARGGTLEGFAVAGADRQFHWADAKIKGKRVVVSSDNVAVPVAVRYAWADNPEATLYNNAGLPASPFRTDDWPGITVKNQ